MFCHLSVKSKKVKLRETAQKGNCQELAVGGERDDGHEDKFSVKSPSIA